MQKFYDDTVITGFYKALLDNIPLPIYDTVSEGDIIISGCYYITKNRLIKCLSTGEYYVDTQMQNVGDIVSADAGSYTIIDEYSFGMHYPNITEKTLLNYNYYNETIHIRLGRYLRCLRDLQGIDLLGMYNCNCLKYADFYLDKENNIKVLNNEKNPYTVYLIPIKFNTKYRIHIDSYKSTIFTTFITEKRELTEFDIKECTPCFFNKPIEVEYTTTEKDTYIKQKYFYLSVQVPKNNHNSLVVIEDNSNVNSQLEFLDTLQQNPFSDKLIEYLCNNVITERDVIENNIRYLKTRIQYLKESNRETSYKQHSMKFTSGTLLNDTSIRRPNFKLFEGGFACELGTFAAMKIQSYIPKLSGGTDYGYLYYIDESGNETLVFQESRVRGVFDPKVKQYWIKEDAQLITALNYGTELYEYVKNHSDEIDASFVEKTAALESFSDTDYWEDGIKDAIHTAYDASGIFDITGYADMEIERKLK